MTANQIHIQQLRFPPPVNSCRPALVAKEERHTLKNPTTDSSPTVNTTESYQNRRIGVKFRQSVRFVQQRQRTTRGLSPLPGVEIAHSGTVPTPGVEMTTRGLSPLPIRHSAASCGIMGSMDVISTEIPDVKIVEPVIFRDARGYFVETYNAARYAAAGIAADFVQDNESCSSRGVLRGLHWQAGRHAQAKLVRVIRGAVWDVAVDIRKGSPTFGKSVSCELTAENGRQFFIPRGFAHGFVVLEDNTLFAYKCDNVYCRESERGLKFDDPALGIEWPWPGRDFLLSEKDKLHPLLGDIEPWEA